MEYLILKWVHIISATILFGTGIGTAFTLFVANRRNDVAGIYFAARHVVLADWAFTTPAVVVQFISGVWLAHIVGYPMTEGWVLWALIGFFFVGACWLPVVKMQLRMRDMAQHAYETGEALPERYWKYDRWWLMLGALAFPAMLVIFYLMIFKPEM